jgi:hypothetical protein
VKTKEPKQIYSETYVEGSVPVNFPLLSQHIEEGKISGYVMKAGELDDGSAFVEMYFIIKRDEK